MIALLKKVLLAFALFSIVQTSSAQLIGTGAGVLSGIMNKKKEKKEKAAAEKAAREQFVKDSIAGVERKIKEEAYQKYQDSVRLIREFEKHVADSIAAVNKMAEKKNQVIHFDPAWVQIGMDSAKFCDRYGSHFEYRLQKNQADQSWTKYSTFLYGVKYGYVDFIVSYLQHKGWASTVTFPTNAMRVKLTRQNYETEKKEVLNMSYTLDKNDRIAKGVITGTSTEVIKLYIDYWTGDYSHLKASPDKGSTYFSYGSDKITLSWVAGNPVVTISKGNVDFQFQQHNGKGVE